MSADAPNAELLEWPNKDKRRFLHALYRVGDLDRTIKFFAELMFWDEAVKKKNHSNAVLGFGSEENHFVLEPTYNYGVTSYDIGTGFGHFGIATEDVYKLVEKVRAKGGSVTREPGPVKGGPIVIAFVKDPDGYVFELIQRGPSPEPLCQVRFRVGGLDRSIKFYEKVAISTNDVYESAEVVNSVTHELGGKISRQPGSETKITFCLDSDGWKTVLVNNEDFLKEEYKAYELFVQKSSG